MARNEHTAKKIGKLKKLPKATLYRVYLKKIKRLIEKSIRLEVVQSDSKFLTGFKSSTEANTSTFMTNPTKKRDVTRLPRCSELGIRKFGTARSSQRSLFLFLGRGY